MKKKNVSKKFTIVLFRVLFCTWFVQLFFLLFFCFFYSLLCIWHRYFWCRWLSLHGAYGFNRQLAMQTIYFVVEYIDAIWNSLCRLYSMLCWKGRSSAALLLFFHSFSRFFVYCAPKSKKYFVVKIAMKKWTVCVCLRAVRLWIRADRIIFAVAENGIYYLLLFLLLRFSFSPIFE